jgi:hypothetical protein
MSNKMKLKRIVDLFTEGDVCYLGDDIDQKPICVWVNKCNSIEEEEARMDAQAARTGKLLELADPMHPEMQNAMMILEEWSDDELFLSAVNQRAEECVALAMHDIEADTEWKDKLEYIRRQPEILNDAGVAEDDPRRVQLETYTKEYMEHLDELSQKRQDDMLEEIKAKGRREVEDEFLKNYRDKLSIDTYMLENKITRLFFGVRTCDAARNGEEWDHSQCNHRERLFTHRSEVRELPDHVLSRIAEKFDEVTVGARNVANFPVAQNSSESSAQPSNQEG